MNERGGQQDEAGGRPGKMSKLRGRLAARRALSGQLISIAHLVGRPVRDPSGARVGRVSDVIIHWDIGVAHPLVAGILVKVGKGLAFVAAQDVTLRQSDAELRFAQLAVATPVRQEGDVALARDVLDRQLVDLAGVQVVRAADVYLAAVGDGWELGGVDVGLRCLARRLSPRRRRRCPPPDRAIDWADLQAFVPRFPDGTHSGQPATAAGSVGSSVQLGAPVAEIHKLRAGQVASLLQGLGRQQQAQLTALAESSTAAQALRGLDPGKREAILNELDAADRARLLASLSEKNDP